MKFGMTHDECKFEVYGHLMRRRSTFETENGFESNVPPAYSKSGFNSVFSKSNLYNEHSAARTHKRRHKFLLHHLRAMRKLLIVVLHLAFVLALASGLGRRKLARQQEEGDGPDYSNVDAFEEMTECEDGDVASGVEFQQDGQVKLNCQGTKCKKWDLDSTSCEGYWRNSCPADRYVYDYRKKTESHRCCSHPMFATNKNRDYDITVNKGSSWGHANEKGKPIPVIMNIVNRKNQLILKVRDIHC